MLIIPILDYLRTKFDISHTFTQKFPSGEYKKELKINHHKLSFKLGIDCFLQGQKVGLEEIKKMTLFDPEIRDPRTETG